MKIVSTSEDLAKHNALTACFFMEEIMGMAITVEMLKTIKKATQNDIENGSISRSVKQYDEQFKNKN